MPRKPDIDWSEEVCCKKCDRPMRPRGSVELGKVCVGSFGLCTTCYQRHGDGSRDRVTKYGITSSEYEALLVSQNYSCATCKTPSSSEGRQLSVDHDHSCCPDKLKSCGACVRGLLCTKCNTALGHFRDSRELLIKAKEYLESEVRYVPRLRKKDEAEGD